MVKRILVIDDSPFIFKAVKRAVEPNGYEMIGQAFNGQEGLNMVDEQNPDVIVLDVTMPVMDGIETAQHLNEKQLTSKVILLSAMGDESLIDQIKSYGVSRFLTKPFNPEDLLSILSQM